jgi:hypothetical protein
LSTTLLTRMTGTFLPLFSQTHGSFSKRTFFITDQTHTLFRLGLVLKPVNGMEYC